MRKYLLCPFFRVSCKWLKLLNKSESLGRGSLPYIGLRPVYIGASDTTARTHRDATILGRKGGAF